MTGGSPYITLLELNQLIRNVLESNLEPSYWVIGEISEFSEARSGHCYMELVEKDSESDQPVAKSRATVWAPVYRMLKPYFLKATGQELGAGIKILVKVNVRYHEQYGLSLTITDIEPAFTLGDIELKRQQTIQRLKDEGILDLNGQLELDPFARHIAVISSPTAAGYGDFINQLNNNDHGFRFVTVLFPAYMQGADAVNSMISAMEKIFMHSSLFHAVVIIRGGGSRSELACFDSYELASHICQMPLPVLSGIGHERDVSVADMVSHSRFKTPTATAQFLIDNLENSLVEIENRANRIFDITGGIISNARMNTESTAGNIVNMSRYSLNISNIRLSNIHSSLHRVSKHRISANRYGLNQSTESMKLLSARYIISENKRLVVTGDSIRPLSSRILNGSLQRTEMLKRIVEAHDPDKIIRKGFSVTRINGRSLMKVSGVSTGDIIETVLSDGKLESKVEIIKK